MLSFDFTEDQRKIAEAERLMDEAQRIIAEVGESVLAQVKPQIDEVISRGFRSVAIKAAKQVPEAFGQVRSDLIYRATYYTPPKPESVVVPKIEPTEFGKTVFPPHGIYNGEPCTCTEACNLACSGDCGCPACRDAYYDTMDYG